MVGQGRALRMVGVGGIVAGIVLMVASSGCSPSGRSERQAAQQAGNDTAVDAIREELTQVPGVVNVHVTYANDPSTAGSSEVALTVQRGTNLELINDLAVRTVWHSQLNPLGSILVGVGIDDDLTQGITHNYNKFDDWDELESRYGPRPVSED